MGPVGGVAEGRVGGVVVRPGALVVVWRGAGAAFVGRVAPGVRPVVSRAAVGLGWGCRERVEALERDGEIAGPGPAGLYAQGCCAGVEGEAGGDV